MPVLAFKQGQVLREGNKNPVHVHQVGLRMPVQHCQAQISACHEGVQARSNIRGTLQRSQG